MHKWAGLLVLAIGCAINQVCNHNEKRVEETVTQEKIELNNHLYFKLITHLFQLSTDFHLDSSMVALLSIAFQAFLSSAGGVYSELLLKDNVEIPLVIKVFFFFFCYSYCDSCYFLYFFLNTFSPRISTSIFGLPLETFCLFASSVPTFLFVSLPYLSFLPLLQHNITYLFFPP